MSEQSTTREAKLEAALRRYVTTLKIDRPTSGPCEGMLTLWGLPFGDEVTRYGLAVATNSYDEASLAILVDVQREARDLLGLPAIDCSERSSS